MHPNVTRSPAPYGRGFFFGLCLLHLVSWVGCDRPQAGSPAWASASPSIGSVVQTQASPSPGASSVDEQMQPTERLGAHRLKLEAVSEGIHITSPFRSGEVWRGHSPLELLSREVRVELGGSATIIDRPVPDGIRLHYLARDANGSLASATIDTPPVQLRAIARPRMVVDKTHYTMAVLDGDEVVKTYPVGLGSEPRKRKICQDNMTTPEGVYTITNLQPNATFFKAYDIDYPNEVDRLRYKIGQEKGLVPPDRDIGGEIQIHGRGHLGNWTFGCVSLSDENMDELFAHGELSAGTEVFLCGSEIRPEDRPWLLQPPTERVKTVQVALRKSGHYSGPIDGQLGAVSQEALGRYQVEKRLPLTCQLDSATRDHFNLQSP